MVTQTLKKWGNSLAIRIPDSFGKQLNLNPGNEIEMEIKNDTLIIKPCKNKYTLDDLLEGMSAENFHEEIDTGKNIGNEIW